MSIYEMSALTGITEDQKEDQKELAKTHPSNKPHLQPPDRLPLLQYAANQQVMCVRTIYIDHHPT
jgi:hypothetical protein